jgi:hypothetical protein
LTYLAPTGHNHGAGADADAGGSNTLPPDNADAAVIHWCPDTYRTTHNLHPGGEFGGELRVELVLNDVNSKSYFVQLEAHRPAIENDLQAQLTWNNPPNARMCRIFLRRQADITDSSKWPEYHLWLKDHLEAFNRVFGSRVKALANAPGVGPTAELR